MGYTTQEVDSLALSTLYPAYYKEMQIHNWGPVDVVITDHTGKQTVIPKWPRALSSGKPFVEICQREFNGRRSKDSPGGAPKEIPIPCKRMQIPYDDFMLYPVKLDELGLTVSTAEHSLVAKNMLAESEYCPDLQESASDFELTDPRFVFEVKDPLNRFEVLYVQALGQTICIRCRHSNRLVPMIDGESIQTTEASMLSCYLRYPSNHLQEERSTIPVFSINLKDIDLEEPYRVQSGDIVCVASSMESLQRVIAKKDAGVNSSPIQVTGMISKEVHDQTVANLQNQIAEDKRIADNKLRSMTASKDATIADLKSKLNESIRERDEFKRLNEYWSSVNSANIERYAKEEKLAAQREDRRIIEMKNDHERRESLFKFAIAILTAITTVTSAALALQSKKK